MIYLIALVSIMLGAVAQYLLKLGMTGIDLQQGVCLPLLRQMVTSLPLWGGLICYALSLILWLLVLSRMELSRAYPLVSLGYIVTLFIGYVLLHEPLTPTKIIGVTIIVVGVFILTR